MPRQMPCINNSFAKIEEYKIRGQKIQRCMKMKKHDRREPQKSEYDDSGKKSHEGGKNECLPTAQDDTIKRRARDVKNI